MVDLFLTPAYFVAGLALISVPIIIHLIKRMRFRRVRWAAMEFLLKSQKRNRKRLIIEQLILLALRCFLVVLAGLLLARFLGFSSLGFFRPQNTTHIVVLDDTLSMTDHWKEQGETKTSFDVARGLIRDIAKSAARAGSAQQFKLITLSEPSTVRFDQRLNDDTLRQLADTLDGLKCTSLHIKPLDGVKAARDIFSEGKQDQRMLHLVGDLRSADWTGPDSTEVNKEIDDLSKSGVRVYMVDAAHPYRGEGRQVVLFHDNLGIVELRPETRVAAEGMPVQFVCTIANFSGVEKKSIFLSVKVEGFERLEASVPILSLPPGYTKQTFMIGFNKIGFNQITANLENEDAGLDGDNKRFAVIEVRKQVPVLVIDGDPVAGSKPGGDSFHLQNAFTAARGYQVVPRGVGELDRPNLEQYPCIYLLNVAELKEKALKNLEEYVKNGGSVAFFLGDKVRPEFYNKYLYKDGKGLFPAPLADRATQGLTEPEKIERMFDDQFKLFFRSEAYAKPEEMPIFGEVAQPGIRTAFKYLVIDRYFPVPRLKWNPEPGKVDEFVTLPNYRPLDEYKDSAQRLLDRLPIEDQKYEKYRPGLEEHKRNVRNALAGKYLWELANALNLLLTDRGDAKDPKKPNLVEFWEQPELKNLRAEVTKFRETVQYGDPLVIGNKFGRGRVVAFLTTAGRSWNDWPGGSPASVTYPVVMLELHKYLTSVGSDNDLTVGTPLDITLDATRYEPKMHGFYEPEIVDVPAAGAKPAAKPTDPGEQAGSISAGRPSFSFTGAREPGL